MALEIENDPGVILDCAIVAIARSGLRVKLNVGGCMIVEPYHTDFRDRRFCIVKFKGTKFYVNKDKPVSDAQTVIDLCDPDSLEVLVKTLTDFLKPL